VVKFVFYKKQLLFQIPTLKPKSNPDRPLPVNKSQVEDFEYGVKEPERVPEGRTTLRNALKFITDHHKNPRLHSAEQIAKEYAIPEETISKHQQLIDFIVFD
jgi:hypothetical protein